MDPEFYVGVYETENKGTKQTKLNSSKYMDLMSVPEGEIVDDNKCVTFQVVPPHL